MGIAAMFLNAPIDQCPIDEDCTPSPRSRYSLNPEGFPYLQPWIMAFNH
jgi:hypothetical protein